MTTGPSMLSLSASGVYAIALLACLSAAMAAVRYRQAPAHARVWLSLTVFFAILAVMRVFAVEEALRDYLRDALRASGSYRERRNFQAPIAASVFVLAASFSGILIYRWTRNLRGRRNVMVIASVLSALAMVFLIALRLTSLHAVDALLYGAAKLNWVVDLGASLVVILAGLSYVRLVRARP